MQTIPDDEIIAIFHRGGKNADKAFQLLVSKYGGVLYRQIRMIAKNHEWTNDILQEVLVKIFKNLASFKGDSALYTWMFRIARNETINFLQKEKRRTGIDVDGPILEIMAGGSEDSHMDGEKISSLLEKAIEQLPEKQALVFHLKYFEDLKYSEIAEQLGTSEGALKASFFHAKTKIQEFLLNELNQ